MSRSWRRAVSRGGGRPSLPLAPGEGLVPPGLHLARQDIRLPAGGEGEQVVGQDNAAARAALVNEETVLHRLPVPADVKGVDDVLEAQADRGLNEPCLVQLATVMGPEGIKEPALGGGCLLVFQLQVR